MIFTAGKARIRHAQSGEIHEIDSADVEFDELGMEERGMGAETTYEAVLDHPALGKLVWTLWEYPVGAENDRETEFGDHELLENIHFSLAQPSNAEKRDARIKSLIDWFFERFEDPVHETPYNGREGGYQYINGGPYDAREELENNFPKEDESILTAAVSEIESDGTLEWAPTRVDGPPDEYYESMRDKLDGSISGSNVVHDLEKLIDTLPSPELDPIFELNDNSVVQLVTPPDIGDPQNHIPILDELRETVADLLNTLSGTNAYTYLLDIAHYYYAGLATEAFSISRVYARGVRLGNAATELKAQIEADELPNLPESASADLSSILDLHGSLVMTHPEGLALVEGAKQFQQTPENVSDLKAAAESIQTSVEEAKDLFSDDAREVIAAAIEDIGQGEYPSRSNHVAAITLGNLGVNLLKFVRNHGLSAIVGGAIVTSGPGLTAIAGSAAGIDAVWTFLMANAQAFHILAGSLGTNLGWVTPLRHAFERLSTLELK